MRYCAVKKFESGVDRRSDHRVARHHHSPGDRADARRAASPACRSSWARISSASSRAATCASRPSSTQPVSSVMTPKDRLVTVRENAPQEEVLGLLHKHRIEKVLVVDRAAPAQGHDHRQGYPEGHRASARLQGRERPAARRRGGRHEPGHAGSRRSAARGRRRRGRRRYLAWPFARRAARWSSSIKARWPDHAGHRRQHRHGGSARDLVKAGADARQGRHRPGLDLHHAHRRRRRRAADHGGRQCRRGAGEGRACR